MRALLIMRIKIYTTGGTIDKIYFDKKSEYQVGDPQTGGVLERANVILDYEIESITKKDSLDFTLEDRNLIRDAVKSTPEDKIVITHGTDTMIETARMLKGLKGKTIVMTGSIYPAQFRDSDAVFNIGSAITAVQILPSGVYIAMNGRIFDSRSVIKNVELNRFEESE
jgi:L-asparaginase